MASYKTGVKSNKSICLLSPTLHFCYLTVHSFLQLQTKSMLSATPYLCAEAFVMSGSHRGNVPTGLQLTHSWDGPLCLHITDHLPPALGSTI